MFAGLLPLLLFGVFAAAVFVNDTEDVAPEADPDDPSLGSAADPEADDGEDTEDTPTEDSGTGDDAGTGGDTGAGDEIGSGDDLPSSDEGAAALSEIIDEEDGEDDVITLDLSAAALAALATDEDAPEEDGFTAFLDGGDELTVTLSDDIAGRVLELSTEYLTEGQDGAADQSRFALTLYILPDGAELPDDLDGVSEAQLIDDLGLARFGEIDLGQLVSQTDESTGEVTILEDTRQTEVPLVVSNRAIVSATATFI